MELIAEEGYEGFVGSAFYWWSGQGDFQGCVVNTGDGVFAGSGVDADIEGAAVGGVAEGRVWGG